MPDFVIALLGIVAAIGGVLLFVKLRDKRKRDAMTSIAGNGLAQAGSGDRAEENLIGPVAYKLGQRVNLSVGCPPTLLPTAGAIGYVDIPQSEIKGLSGTNPIDGQPAYADPDGHIHYVTFNHGPIDPNAKAMEVTFRVEADEMAEIRPRTGPALPSMVSLYLQRKGEDFSGVGEKVYFRWFSHETLLWQQGVGWHNRGEFTISAPFDIDHWFEEDAENHDLQGNGLPNDPARRERFFREALADCELVGFVLGGGDGKGHGVFAHNGPVRLVLVSRRIV